MLCSRLRYSPLIIIIALFFISLTTTISYANSYIIHAQAKNLTHTPTDKLIPEKDIGFLHQILTKINGKTPSITTKLTLSLENKYKLMKLCRSFSASSPPCHLFVKYKNNLINLTVLRFDVTSKPL